MTMIFNVLVGCFAAVVAAIYWSDPTVQFWVGGNTVIAFWCFNDFLKEYMKISKSI